MKQFLKDMLSTSNNVSSKRVMGCIGWILILIIYSYCAITEKSTPDFTDVLIMAVVTLLGVDSITNAFNRPNKGPEE